MLADLKRNVQVWGFLLLIDNENVFSHHNCSVHKAGGKKLKMETESLQKKQGANVQRVQKRQG